jgi:RNA polymerase sigma-70 factor (ECF subfamily)
MNEEFHDRELIERVVDGDRKAFTTLYSRHLDNLYKYIYLFTKSDEESEELVQKVFVSIWEHRSTLHQVKSFKAYIFRCAKNRLIDRIRSEKAKAKMYATIQPATEESEDRSDSHLIYNQYTNIIDSAINLLPEKRKEIVRLRTQDDLTLDEIAEKLSISKFVVKKQLYAGLRFIRAYLEKFGELSPALLAVMNLSLIEGMLSADQFKSFFS